MSDSFKEGGHDVKKMKLYVKEAVMFIPNFLKLLYRLLNSEMVTKTDRILLYATIAYVVSPLDILPDITPVFGQLDDAFLVCLVLRRLMDSVPQSELEKYWDGNQDLLRVMDGITELATKLLPEGIYRRILKKSRPPEPSDTNCEIQE